MRHVPGPLIAAMSLVLLAACGGDASTSTNGEAALPPQPAAPGVDGGSAETVADGSDFCRAWDELQQADSPAAPLLQALLDAAPSGLEDNVAMYAEIVEEQGTTQGIVSAMNFEQEVRLFAITDWYVQNCVGS